MENSDTKSLFLDQVKGLVSPDQFKIDLSTFQAYLTEPRGIYEGRPCALVMPRTTAQVAAIMQCASKCHVPVVVQGGNTGLVGGQIPDRTGQALLLSLTQMDVISAPDALSNTLVAQAGATLARVREAAEACDRLFPLSLASQNACTIGGNLATNAGGMSVITYGSMRNLALGLEVVLADGRIWNGLSSLLKDNTGYALKDLFIGSEGTLGIITAATLKLFPKPQKKMTTWFGIPSVQAAVKLLESAKNRAGFHIFACELMSEKGIELVCAHDKNLQKPVESVWHILLELHGAHEEDLESALEQILNDMRAAALDVAAVVASSQRQGANFWRLRELMSEAQRSQGRALKFDICVPIGDLPHFLEAATSHAERLIPECRVVAFGHIGDGSLHFDVCPPLSPDGQAKLLGAEPLLSDAVVDLLQAVHGSISAEHGIGRRKRDLLARVKDPVALSLMRNLKHALDPKGLLNPGVIL